MYSLDGNNIKTKQQQKGHMNQPKKYHLVSFSNIMTINTDVDKF